MNDLATQLAYQHMREKMGCDTQSCLTEIAGATGAHFILFPKLMQRDDTFVFKGANLKLINNITWLRTAMVDLLTRRQDRGRKWVTCPVWLSWKKRPTGRPPYGTAT